MMELELAAEEQAVGFAIEGARTVVVWVRIVVVWGPCS